MTLDRHEMLSAQDLYEEYLTLIREGCTPFEANARDFAKVNKLPLHPLEAALKEAYARLMRLYIAEIEQGRTSYAESAYEIARKQNLSTEKVDAALRCAAKTIESSHRDSLCTH